MKRTRAPKTSLPTAILTSDWHLREDTPICRTDDFQEAQWKKVEEIATMQRAYDCPVFHAGDLFNHWKPSPWLISKTLEHLPDKFWTVYGNHDLPQHQLDLAHKSGVYTMARALRVNILPGMHWGDTDRPTPTLQIRGRKVLVWHTMCYQGRKPWPGFIGNQAAGTLRKYSEFDLILTGHNHESFVEKHEGRVLVNPGNITRQTSDQIHRRPQVYLWYADSNTVEAVELMYSPDVISREHIEIQERRDERIDAFVSKLDDDWKADMNFEDNLERFYQLNDTPNEVKNIITKAIHND